MTLACERIEQQKLAPIRVVLMNPPYSVGQKSGNDNAQNQHYPHLEERIRLTYAARSSATLKNSLYDSYIKAIRMASDRLDVGNRGGVAAFISNGAWLDGNAQDGLRACLLREYDRIYVFNLRGNQRTSGELSRREGGKIFGSGSRTPIAMTLLVRRPGPRAEHARAQIFYHDIGDYLTREEKLARVKACGSLTGMPWTKIVPNDRHDWLNQRDASFARFVPLGDKKGSEQSGGTTDHTVFISSYSRGLATGRDAWCYNSSRAQLERNLRAGIDFYNAEVDRYQALPEKVREGKKPADLINLDPTKFKWDFAQKEHDLPQGKHYAFDGQAIRTVFYRPFFKTNGYYHRQLNARWYKTQSQFPQADADNLVICVPGVGDNKPFMPLICDSLPDLHFNQTSQCFPLYA